MLRTVILAILALVGVGFAMFSAVNSARPAPVAPPVAPPARSPFESFIAGSGIVEASTENLAIAPVVGGVVTRLYVRVGDVVEAGARLFTVDDREARAQLATQEAALADARSKLEKLVKLPRPEDVAPVRARLTEAQTSLADLETQFKLADSVSDKRALSVDQLNQRRYAADGARARVEEAQALLAQIEAGTWEPDLAVARAEVALASAQVAAARTELERLTVCAPVAGKVLQLKVRLGEFAPTGALSQPLLLLGAVERLHVRVDIDEDDAWRYSPGAEAVGSLRGNSRLKTPLRFEYVEPYVVPKMSLTGESTERVDTRVMQVIYSFDPASLPVLVGQQLDIFLKAAPTTEAPPEGAGSDGAGKGR